MAKTRLLFVHDHRFQRDSSCAYYTSGSFPASIWPRYLEHFDNVTVLARDGGELSGAAQARSDYPGVDFVLIKSLDTLSRLGLRRGKAHHALRAQIAAADAVIARLPSDLGLQAVALANEAGKPLLIEVVGCAYDALAHHGAPMARIYAPIAFVRMRAALTQTPFALYVTNTWLQQRYPTLPKAVTAGVSDVVIAESSPEISRSRSARLAELVRGRVPVLGTVGSLRTAAKGFHIMFDALGKLRREQALKLEYRILGSGDPTRWRELASKAGVSDQVHFDGVLPSGPQVLSWLDAIDIHVQPSFQEGLPRATIEAMSRGCACIGSSAGGLPELINPDLLHKPGDSVKLAETISTLVGDVACQEVESARSFDISRGYTEVITSARRHALLAKFRAAIVAR